MTLFYFSDDEALKYGIHAAIVLNCIRFWVKTNKANGRNQHDGRTWTYNSKEAWAEFFPFLSEPQVKRALEKLKECGAVRTGNFNKNRFDRTLWYALEDESSLETIDRTNSSNRADATVQPIPIKEPVDEPSDPSPPVPVESDGQVEEHGNGQGTLFSESDAPQQSVPSRTAPHRQMTQAQKQRLKTKKPKTPQQHVLDMCFRRRVSTKWSIAEQRAFEELCPIPASETQTIEDYYTAEIPEDQDYRRRDLLTLLNNWQGELDRAHRWLATHKKAKKVEAAERW